MEFRCISSFYPCNNNKIQKKTNESNKIYFTTKENKFFTQIIQPTINLINATRTHNNKLFIQKLYKQSKSIERLLSKNKPLKNQSVFKCNRLRCASCAEIIVTNKFYFTKHNQQVIFYNKSHLTCKSRNVGNIQTKVYRL